VIGVCIDIQQTLVNGGPHALQTLNVQVDWSIAEVVATGPVDARRAIVREQRPEHVEAGAHLVELLERHLGCDVARVGEVQLVRAEPIGGDTEGVQGL